MRTPLAFATFLFVAPAAFSQPPEAPTHPGDRHELADRYRETAGQILGAALTDVDGWAKLEHLALRIGHRLSGSAGLERAIQWAADTMRNEELDRVHLQEVMVPHWVRGQARATLLAPAEDDLPILALGGSVASPPEGITAPVVVARSFEELAAMPRAEVEGRIVVWAVPWTGYGGTGAYRRTGAARAAAKGAVASLVRSATGRSLNTPHTGNQGTKTAFRRSRRRRSPSKMPRGCGGSTTSENPSRSDSSWRPRCFPMPCPTTSWRRSPAASCRTRSS